MKLISKVDPIDVKRCFVASQYIRKKDLGNKRYLPKLSRQEFLKKLNTSKVYVSKLTERNLDKEIADEYKKRLGVYNKLDWYVAEVLTNEVGVWKKAGGLPLEWTTGSLKETAQLVKKGLATNDKRIAARSRRAIPRMTDILDLISKERYLYPIIVPGGMMGRKGLKKMKGDIDDGNMRAITMTVSGSKKLRVFMGVLKKLAS